VLNVSADKPYPFDANVQAGRTKLVARGEVTKPFDLGQVQARFSLEGPDLNDLYGLTGLALPNTPPYKVSGRMTRDDTLYRVRNLAGRVGDSDLNGVVSVETKGERPLLTADLTSRRLDFDDLATIFGGAPDARETASAEQKVVAAKLNASNRLLPDATLQVDRVRAMDADVKYSAASIFAPGLPLKDVALVVDLKNGLPQGHRPRPRLRPGPPVRHGAAGRPRQHAAGRHRLPRQRPRPAAVPDQDRRLARRRQPRPRAPSSAAPGTPSAAPRQRRTARSPSSSPAARCREAFAELIGINVIKGLGLLFSKDTGRTELSCAIADFRVTDGIMRSNQLLADTDRSSSPAAASSASATRP
jgi:uncharacterized protein involved in outer membrane biogenesis